MQDFEKLGAFYLGKQYDLATQRVGDDLLMYDAKDLTTHGVCVGMTGSGKTGLCLALLEEAGIDGIPAIAIDPKGDLGNLLLAFPELRPADFRPWVDPAEATRKGLTADQYAEQTARQWRDGLAAWGQDPARIARFRDAVDIAIYTPGSNAGLPLTVLRSFAAPSAAVLQNADALRERIAGAVSGLLALLGIDADPLRSREHILLANVLDHAWRAGRDVDMGGLIREIQSPPFDKVGYLDLQSFFPDKERFNLAMSLNNLLASPGFAAWMEGEALDIQSLLYTPEGKPRLSIISIAHLSESERMFFVTILLNEMIAWMRGQSGTSSLRALLYMDEVFGYFPPTANPPTKTPMLTLLKQARAFGLGVMLATQNPVDLDYKGLSNAGTWFLGRLQTERDKARVLEGLEGASAAAGSTFDRQKMEQTLAGLGNRVFLMNNVHEDQPVVFQSRWALSYLRGPLSRDQISTLMASRKQAAAAAPPTATPAAAAGAASAATSAAGVAAVVPPAAAAASRPVLPPGISEFFLPRRGNLPDGTRLLYRPALVGTARVHFAQATAGIDAWENLTLLAAKLDDLSDTVWDAADVANEDNEPELEKQPESGAGFANLPGELAKAKKYADLATALKNCLYRGHRMSLWKCSLLKAVSKPGESEGDFRVRLSQGIKEQRDLQVEKLRAKYAPKLAAIQEQVRKAGQRVDREKAQASQSKTNAMISMGTSILGALFGRKLTSASNVGRAATSIRSASKIAKEQADVGQAEASVEALQQRAAELDAQFKAEAEKIQESLSSDSVQIEELQLQPKKTDIAVSRVALVWAPWAISGEGVAERAW